MQGSHLGDVLFRTKALAVCVREVGNGREGSEQAAQKERKGGGCSLPNMKRTSF